MRGSRNASLSKWLLRKNLEIMREQDMRISERRTFLEEGMVSVMTLK